MDLAMVMPPGDDNVVDMEKLVSLCKRRGFIFPSSEIYGGINGFWDYGPLGVELKRNIKDAWWHDNVHARDDMVGLDCSIIMNPKVWEASGHVGGFSDPMVDCRACKARFRADQLISRLVVLVKEDGEEKEFQFSGLGSVEEVRESTSKKLEKVLRGHPGFLPPVDLCSNYLQLKAEHRATFECPSCA